MSSTLENDFGKHHFGDQRRWGMRQNADQISNTTKYGLRQSVKERQLAESHMEDFGQRDHL